MYINDVDEVSVLLATERISSAELSPDDLLAISKKASDRLCSYIERCSDEIFKRRQSAQRRYLARQMADIARNEYNCAVIPASGVARYRFNGFVDSNGVKVIKCYVRTHTK